MAYEFAHGQHAHQPRRFFDCELYSTRGAVKRMCGARKAQAAQFPANALPIIRYVTWPSPPSLGGIRPWTGGQFRLQPSAPKHGIFH